MNKRNILVTLIIILGLTAGYYLVLPAFIVIEKNEEISFNSGEEINLKNVKDLNTLPALIHESNFQPGEYDVQGKVIVLEKDNQRILRFQDFETIGGPDLHIYLVDSKDKSNFIDLGQIKATKGNVNYDLPSNIDFQKYNQVQVYCVPFKKVFSFADLIQK